VKEFNVTGLCIPEKHFMVDISGNIEKMNNMEKKMNAFMKPMVDIYF